jgi:hypothetical protein
MKPSVADFVVGSSDNIPGVQSGVASKPSLDEIDLDHAPPG